jgi:hypothetical protein
MESEPAGIAANAELPEVLSYMVVTGERRRISLGEKEVVPVVSVVLSATEAHVKLTEPEVLTEGVLSRIQRITQPRRRRFPPLKFRPRGVFPYVQVSVASDSSAVLINAYRVDRPSFWQRTRDDWGRRNGVAAARLGTRWRGRLLRQHDHVAITYVGRRAPHLPQGDRATGR